MGLTVMAHQELCAWVMGPDRFRQEPEVLSDLLLDFYAAPPIPATVTEYKECKLSI